MASLNTLTTTFMLLINCVFLQCYDVNNYYVSSLAVYKNRAFLTLPRSSCYNNITIPTLIEAHINYEQQTLTQVKIPIFSNSKFKKLDTCDAIQDAISAEVENRRLWILDRGSKKCPSKLIVYNLNNNNEIYTCLFDGIPNQNMKVVVVGFDDKSNPLAYIASSENKLMIVSLTDQKWWTITLNDKNNPNLSLKIDRLALSQIDPLMYITADDDERLYSVNLSDITPQGSIVYAEEIGTKLGPSAGIAADVGGGLNYYLTRDYAILRWTESTPLTAENHDVLIQSYEILPYVSHLFKTLQNDIWALINPLPVQDCATVEDRKNFRWPTEIPEVHNRIMQLVKVIKKVPNRKV